MQPAADPALRQQISLRRIAGWGLVIGIPLALLGLAAIVWDSADSVEAAVQAYRTATPCPVATAPTATCYVMVPGKLTDYRITHGRGLASADMTIQTASGIFSTSARPSVAEESLITSGAPVSVQFYQGKLVAVYFGDQSIATTDNPLARQQDTRTAAGFLVFVAAAIVFTLFLGRLKARSRARGAGFS